jgi:hypothetical protein
MLFATVTLSSAFLSSTPSDSVPELHSCVSWNNLAFLMISGSGVLLMILIYYEGA